MSDPPYHDQTGVHFSAIDYGIFTIMLMLSSLIGLYYGFVAKKKQNNTAEYLLGGKKMSIVPIAVSLIVTSISGVTMLGMPTEIYSYGSQFWLSFIPASMVSLSLIYVFYPVFYDLKLLSMFMYLELRFNRTIRLLASGAACTGLVVMMPMVIYIPALAFNQVSGVNVHVTTLILSATCLFYTTLGGLRAVVWTDAFQFVLMIGAVFAVIFMGILNLDRPTDLFSIADEGGRLILFDLNPSPLARSTVWTMIFGFSVYWCSCFGATQSCVQKLLSLGDTESGKKAIWIYGAGLIAFNLTAVVVGLVMYVNLYDCDPYTAGFVRKLDQVVPYFVMKIGGQIPGLPGLFIAGLFSAGLSSMSGGLNSLSAVIYDDFLKNRLKNASEESISRILKFIVLGVGILVLLVVFVLERLSTVYELTLAIHGLGGGAIFGLFTTGMLCRQVNTKGAIAGAIASVALLLTIIIGAQSTPQAKTLPMRTDGCATVDSNWNATSLSSVEQPTLINEEDIFWLFRISYQYYTLIGCATFWIVSYLVGSLTQTDEIVDEKLLAPFLRTKKVVVEVEISSLPEQLRKF